jgi:hypothetical protein
MTRLELMYTLESISRPYFVPNLIILDVECIRIQIYYALLGKSKGFPFHLTDMIAVGVVGEMVQCE